MTNTRKAVNIPNEVVTVNDLKWYVRRIHNIPFSTKFQLRAYTNKGSKKGVVALKGDQYIIELEDNHSGQGPLTIYPYWELSRERRRELRESRKRQEREFEDRRGRTKHVCGTCIEAAVSVGTVGLPSQDWPMPPAIGAPEAYSVPQDVPAAKRKRRTSTPIGSELPGGQCSWCGAAEQTSPGEVQQRLSFSCSAQQIQGSCDHWNQRQSRSKSLVAFEVAV